MADIKLGSSAIDTFKVGVSQVDSIYKGTTLIWQNATIYFTDYTYYLPLTIDNTGNPDALTADQIQIDLTASNFDFTKVLASGYDIIFADSAGNQYSFWRKSFDKTGETATFFVKVTDGAAASNHTIRIYYGYAAAIDQSSHVNTMLRTSAIAQMNHLFSFSTNENDSIGALTSSGSNTSISDSGCGNGLEFTAASSSYQEIDGLFDTYTAWQGLSITFVLKADHQNGSAAQVIFRKNNVYNTNLFRAFLNTDGTLRISFTRASATKNVDSVQNIFYAGVPYTITIYWTGTYIFYFLGETLLGINDYSTTIPNNGTQPLQLGNNYNNSTHTNFLNGWILDFAVFDGPVQFRQLRAFSRKTKIVPTDEMAKWSPVITYKPTGNICSEPSFVYDEVNGKIVMFMNINQPGSKQIARVDSGDGGEIWGNLQVVVGDGVGGEAGTAQRTNAYHEAGGKYYIYYRDASNNYLCRVESDDGVTFSNKINVLAAGAFTDDGTVQNSFIFKEGSTYHGLADATNSVNPLFQTGYFSGVALDSFTWSGTNPQNKLKIDTAGVYGANQLSKIGSKYYSRYLAVPALTTLGNDRLPTIIYRMDANSPSDNSWANRQVLFYLGNITGKDQGGNFRFIDMGSYCIGAISNAYNVSAPNFEADITIYKFNGNETQLITDISISVGTENANT